MTTADRNSARYVANWQDEIDNAALYRAVAEAEPQPQLADVYRKLAETEETHACFWEESCAPLERRCHRAALAGERGY